MSNHVAQHMSGSQKGIGHNSRGDKDQLMVDRAVSLDGKKRKNNLYTTRIDYKKADESMRHKWILECLKLYKIDKNMRTSIQKSNGMWSILEVDSKSIAQVNIKCGIYQGDALHCTEWCVWNHHRSAWTGQEIGFFLFQKEKAPTELLKVVSFVFFCLCSCWACI